ncbi:MAG: accessory gene regulator B family protein [Oscillospiraceae bacterium]|nr:accessory gene regulator B family protein [Oscillospiraceae bacterium]
MLASQAKRISSFCISNGVICEQDREKYDYCYEVLLATALNIFIVALIGLATGFLLQTICFMLVFALLKSTVGGYHADSHVACFAGTVGTFLLYRLIAALIPVSLLPAISAMFAIFAGITVFLLAPVGTKNKPLGRRQKEYLKEDSRLLILFLCMLVLFLLLQDISSQWAFSISSAIAAVSVSLIAGKIKLAKAETTDS